MDNVAENRADFGWNIRDFANPEHPISRLRIVLNDDWVGFAVKESGNSRMEVFDVLFGPFGFDQQPQQPLTGIGVVTSLPLEKRHLPAGLHQFILRGAPQPLPNPR